jgi:hypothetical protein
MHRSKDTQSRWSALPFLIVLFLGVSAAVSTGTTPPPAAPLQGRYSSARGGAAGIRVTSVDLCVNGNMVDIRYGIADLQKARRILNPKSRIFLQDETSGKWLAIADMEQIGKIRSLPGLDAKRGYLMLFNNASRLVKRGSKVALVIDGLRIEDLVVR